MLFTSTLTLTIFLIQLVKSHQILYPDIDYEITNAPLLQQECNCELAHYKGRQRTGRLTILKDCPDLRCDYVIDGQIGSSLILDVEWFESAQHVMEIHETYTVAGNNYSVVLGSFTRHIGRRKVFTAAPGNGLLLRFRSYGRLRSPVNIQELYANFRRLPSSSSEAACSKLFIQASSAMQNLPAPKYLSATSAGCFYVVNATDKNSAVRLRVEWIDNSTTIEVHETENKQLNIYSPIAIITEQKPLPFEVTSKTRSAFIHAYSSSHNKILNSFKAAITSTESPCKCFPKRIIIASSAVEITSPGFPVEYCDNMNCKSNLRIDKSGISLNSNQHCTIRLHILEMEMVDPVHLFQNYDNTSHLLMSLNTDPMPTFPRITYVTFNGEDAAIELATDERYVAKGFNFSFEAFVRNDDCKCPGAVQPYEPSNVNSSIVISAPAGCDFLDCFIHVDAPPLTEDRASYQKKATVRLQIEHRLKGGEEEFIEVISRQRLGSIHHTTPLKEVIRPEGSGINLYSLYSEYPIIIWYHLAEANSANTALVDIKYEWREQDCDCGETSLFASSGWNILTSPGYPFNYCNLMNCTYRIIAPYDHHIIINFTDVSTENGRDFIQIYRKDGQLIKTVTGSGPEKVIRTRFNEAIVQFTTDESVTRNGFELFYYSESDEPSSAPGNSVRILFSIFALFLAISAIAFISYKVRILGVKRSAQQTSSTFAFTNFIQGETDPYSYISF